MRSLIVFILLIASYAVYSQDSTYAERLGYPKGSRVVILHVDDVGMSYDSNKGAIDAMEKGVANSCSIMMPCGWVPQFAHYLSKHSSVDAGLHLTLTSEWKEYRWGPLAGKSNVPGLVDKEGAMWSTVQEVVQHSNADEIEKEIRAQIDRAKNLGIEPTHLDSHMGTLFATPAFMERYIKVGEEFKIPVMFPGGHNALISKQMNMPDAQVQMLRQVAKGIWNTGLPVLDDLYNETYSWAIPRDSSTDENLLRKFKTRKYIEALRSLKPGVTMVIMHCTATTEVFPFISDSGPVRKGDLLTMMDPEFKEALKREKIILTTWRELMVRRSNIRQ
jgi:predicted glycoside hydrolase/deacetylase ChbG (UPF0249 family)